MKRIKKQVLVEIYEKYQIEYPSYLRLYVSFFESCGMHNVSLGQRKLIVRFSSRLMKTVGWILAAVLVFCFNIVAFCIV